MPFKSPVRHNNDIVQDKYHCLFPLYNQIRNKYILGKYYVYSPVYKLHALLRSCTKEELLPPCLYIKEDLKIRNSLFINM